VDRQLRLELQRSPSYRREDFVVSPANAEAVRAVEAWPAWPAGVLALIGPAGSGKSHLAQIWTERSHAVAVDLTRPTELHDLRGRLVILEDAELAPSETLFHLINMAGQAGGGLLLTSRLPPASWPTDLPDLRSRLNALTLAELGAPDDELLEAVLSKFFRERNIRPPDDLFSYLIRRMERSVPVALALVEKLDEAADAEHRPISRALARQIIEGEPDTGDLFATPLAKSSPWRENS
jgi:chromosomal replication initiation ATPase DnaA